MMMTGVELTVNPTREFATANVTDTALDLALTTVSTVELTHTTIMDSAYAMTTGAMTAAPTTLDSATVNVRHAQDQPNPIVTHVPLKHLVLLPVPVPVMPTGLAIHAALSSSEHVRQLAAHIAHPTTPAGDLKLTIAGSVQTTLTETPTDPAFVWTNGATKTTVLYTMDNATACAKMDALDHILKIVYPVPSTPNGMMLLPSADIVSVRTTGPEGAVMYGRDHATTTA